MGLVMLAQYVWMCVLLPVLSFFYPPFASAVSFDAFIRDGLLQTNMNAAALGSCCAYGLVFCSFLEGLMDKSHLLLLTMLASTMFSSGLPLQAVQGVS